MDVKTAGETSSTETTPSSPAIGFAEAARYWLYLGFISFGGPAGQISIMQTDCVDKKRWIDQQAFLRGLNYSMLLPGPEAQQLAAYIGWRLHGIWGAITAGTLFFLPGAIIMMALAWIAAAHGDNSWVIKIFNGIKPAVIGIIVFAVWRIGRKTCNSAPAIILAAAAFAALYFAHIPFPLIILAAGILGALIPALGKGGGHGHGTDGEQSTNRHMDSPKGNPWTRLMLITLVFIVLLAVPVAGLLWLAGPDPFLSVARLFTTAAFVTFGGAYAVLPYITEAAVNTHGWIAPGDMLNGLALAESTPGPLVLVNTYVGFFAGWNGNGASGLSQLAAALLAASLTTYVTFLPSFLFIIAGAPYVDALQSNERARRALSGITTAVVGVIFNLAVFLGQSVLITKAGGIEWASAAIALGALALLLSGRVPIPALVGIGAVLGALGVV
ncbi:MAG: chromate efflux transporter [Rhodospirillales bacterium]